MFEETLIATLLGSAMALFLFKGGMDRGKRPSNRRLVEPFMNHTRSKQSTIILNTVKRKLHRIFNKTYRFNGLLEPLNHTNVMGRINLEEGDKSFTINKQNIYLCIKDKNNHTFYDENVLVYVVLHEIAHVLCDEVGHTHKFINIFNALLDRANAMGEYNPNKPFIEGYCM